MAIVIVVGPRIRPNYRFACLCSDLWSSSNMQNVNDEPRAVDAAAILSEIWAKNALRREAGLPLWPVCATFERELGQARWRVHLDLHYARVCAEVLAERRAKFGSTWGYSVGGNWAVHLMAMQQLRVSFAGR